MQPTITQIRKLARQQIPGLIEGSDLGFLFGEELADLMYEPGYEWVGDVLEAVKRETVKKLTPKFTKEAESLQEIRCSH